MITVTGGRLRDRNTLEPDLWPAFTPGLVKPVGSRDAGVRNVGPRMEDSALTVYNGDITLTTNQVLTGMYINGKVTCAAGTTGAVVRDCVIRGVPGTTSQSATAVGPSYNFRGTVFEWCRFDATGTESLWQDCIDGGNYTVRYSELLRGVDGMGANIVGNATMETSRIYHGKYASWWNDSTGTKRTATFTDYGGNTVSTPFTAHASGDTHSDGAQIQGYSGWVIRGCNIGAPRSVANTPNLDPTLAGDYAIVTSLDDDASFANAAIIINANSTNPVGALIESNWLDGGTAKLNLATAGTDLLAGVTVRNNRFGRGTGFTIYAQNGHQATLTGNVFDDNDSPATVTNWG